MKKNIIIVETPLQLLCGYEAFCYEDNNAAFYLRLTGRGRNDTQLVYTAETLKINYKTFILKTDNVLLGLFFNIPLLLKLSFIKYDKIYVGSYSSRGIGLLSRIASAKEVYFLDDGVGTYLAQKKIALENTPSSLFTFFNIIPLQGQKIIKHSFENIKKIFNCKKELKSYFIGQPLYDYNYVSKEQYIACVENAVSLSKNYPVVYIPHRTESKEFLTDIAKISNISIEYADTCIELYLLNKGLEPDKVFSCCSSALFSLPAIFTDCNYTAYRISDKKYNVIAHLNEVYESLGKIQNMTIINFD